MKRCKDCRWGNKCNRVDYCGKLLNDKMAYSYDYYLPKSQRNPLGECEDFNSKWYIKIMTWRLK